jgi:hypothetical protein
LPGNCTSDLLKQRAPVLKGCYIKRMDTLRRVEGFFPGRRGISRTWGGCTGRTPEEAENLVLSWLWECHRDATNVA